MNVAVFNVLAVIQQHALDNFISRDRERIHSYAMELSVFNSDDTEAIEGNLALFSEVEATYTVVNLETGSFYNNKMKDELQMSADELEFYSKFLKSFRCLFMGIRVLHIL